MTIKTTWDPAMLVVAHTLYEITMNQYAIDTDQIWRAIHQLNVLGKDSAKLLEVTKKMTKYSKKSYKHNKTHHDSTDSNPPRTNQDNTSHSDKKKTQTLQHN